MGQALRLNPLKMQRQLSVTEAVYHSLYNAIVRLELLPGTKMSEADVAQQLDVSRQPVRDAFYRLNQQGFLLVRPQRATVVTKISISAVLRARFIRTALEVEAIAEAMKHLTQDSLDALEGNIEAQAVACKAGDRELFQQLDDDFHAQICTIAGHPEVWDLIKDTKAHMDRVRYLTLDKGKGQALQDHKDLLAAMQDDDSAGASAVIRKHLSRIEPFMQDIRPEHIDYFEEEDREY